MAWYESNLVVAIFGFSFGFVVNQFIQWAIRFRRRKGLWQALNAEILACRKKADGFLSEPYKAPLYRLPTIAYLNCLPLLLADGDLNGDEAGALTDFFGEVETLNRGLDLASAARGNTAKLENEDSRNRLKAKRLSAVGDYFTKAHQITSTRSKGVICRVFN